MTETQKKLYILLKEIDDICRKNNITYYLAGGTALGALRHKGYIPWDDDADILMTRDHYYKFLEAVKNNLPDNRCVECQEFNRNYHNNFARYIDLNSTAIHTNQITHDDAAGFVIDILILDPIPDDAKKQWKYIKTIQLYADLINPSSRYSFRWQTNMFAYFFSRMNIRLFGKERVLQKLEDKMAQYKEEDCTKYILRWGGVPLISDKSIYGKGRECEFENTTFIIPEHAEDYLTWHYGDNWMFLPDHAERSTHNAVYCYDTPYDLIKKEAFQYYDYKRIYRIYLRRKILLFLGMYPWFLYRKTEAIKRERNYNKKYNTFINAKEKEIQKAAKQRQYGKIRKLLKAYISTQNRRGVIGREDYSGIYRFRHPIYIHIPDDYFDIVLTSLIANGDTSLALRFIDVKESRKALNTRENSLKNYILTLQEAISLYDKKQYLNAENMLDELLKLNIECITSIKLKIRLAFQNSIDEQSILNWIRKGENLAKRNSSHKYKADGDLLKDRADILSKGLNLHKLELYIQAYQSTNNGITKLEIKTYMEKNIENILQQISTLKNSKDKKSLYYIENLCKITSNDEIMCILGECSLQFMKKPRDLWNVVYRLRKYIESSNSSSKSLSCMQHMLSVITKNDTVAQSYTKIIFEDSYDTLERINHELVQSIESLEWKLLLTVLLKYKQGDIEESIHTAIQAYKTTNNKHIRYLLCLIFRAILKMYSDYIMEKLKDVDEIQMKKRNDSYISAWKNLFTDFEETCKMFEDIKVLPKNDFHTYVSSKNIKEFDFGFFRKSKEFLDMTPFSITLMLKKIYGISFIYDRNGT